ncbi:GntP family permease [Halanaerobaculum tunisiense]
MDVLILPILLVMFAILAFKRVSAPLLGPIVTITLILVLGLPMYDTMLGPYMAEAAGYFKKFFLIFLTGALFGAVMEDTGAAKSIAHFIIDKTGNRWAAPMIMIITGILTYGGISGFVVFFAMFPLAIQLFKATNIPRRLIPAAISSGTWTWSMNSPGTPAIQNIIPMKYLGTGPTAALIPGIASGLLQFILIFAFLEWRGRYYKSKGLTFDSDPTSLELVETKSEAEDHDLPHPALGAIPCILILVLFNLFRVPVEGSVAIGVIVAMILLKDYVNGIGDWIDTLNKGTHNSAIAILNTAAVVGFAGVVKTTTGFEKIIDWLRDLNMSPLWFVAVTAAVAAGVAGSASGGLAAAYSALGDTYRSLGIRMEYVHRISAISAGIMDTLPHQGALITLLAICKLTHKEAYFDVAITQILIPFIAVATAAIPLCAMGL